MPDLFESLKQLDEQLPAAALPATEVRRRGDRMRRRRAGLRTIGVVAVLAVVASAGVLGGRLDLADREPAPTRHPAPHFAWPNSIARDFPITVGLDRPKPLEPAWMLSSRTAQPWTNLPCVFGDSDVDAYLDPADSHRLASRYAESQSSLVQTRQLVLYDDQQTTASAVAAIRSLTERCTGEKAMDPDVGHRWSWTTTEGTYAGRSGLVLTGNVGGTAARPDLRVAVVPAGNALLVASVSDGATGAALQRFTDGVDTMSAAMCTFTPGGCGSRPVLGSDGYGALRLTMDEAGAKDAGLTRLQADRGAACRAGRIGTGGLVYLSAQHGVAGIFLGKGMRTDRGIGLGSTQEQVLAAYPEGSYDAHRYWVVEPSAGVRLQIAMPDGTVEEVGLSLTDQDCFG